MSPKRTTKVVRSGTRAGGSGGESGRMQRRSIQSQPMISLLRLASNLGPGLVLLALAGHPAPAVAKGPAAPRFYFSVVDVKSEVPVDESVRVMAKEVLAADLAGRPEFTSDLGGITGDALVAELARRHLKGFDVSMKLVAWSHELQAPRPGGRLKQLAVATKVAVFGTTIGEAKLAFGGDGEATVVAEVVERRLAEESKPIDHDVLVQAVRQAVDQAVAKLGQVASKPFNESKPKRKPKGK
jgi:hypothetical protein